MTESPAAPTTPRPAASVVLVRPNPAETGQWQMYLVQRSTESPLLAGFWVFPGGTLRADDYDTEAGYHSPDFGADVAHAALNRPEGRRAASPEESLAYFVAAARELFEEAGVLLGNVELGGAAILDPGDKTRAAAQRLALEQGGTLTALADEVGLALRLADLLYYAHWITPEAVRQRFDTRFFIALLPKGQAPEPSPYEVAQGTWIDPSSALERSRSGDFKLHFATLKHIQRLAAFPLLDDLLAFARTKPVPAVMPPTRSHNGQIVPHLDPQLEGVW